MAGKLAHDLREIFLNVGVPFGSRSHENRNVVIRTGSRDSVASNCKAL